MSEHEKQVDYNSVVQQINSSDEWKQLDMGGTRRIDHNEVSGYLSEPGKLAKYWAIFLSQKQQLRRTF